MNTLKKLYDLSVFRRSTQEERDSPLAMMVLMFHRASAVKYFLIGVWGVVSLVWGIQSIAVTWGEWLQEFYSGTVAVVAFFSWIGASYFPRFARYELFATGSLVALMAMYTVVVTCLAFQEGEAWYPLMVFSLTPMTLPVVRVIYIYRTLISEARRKNES